MVDIMQALQGYLGADYPSDRRVGSGGDQLTSERQAAAQRHLMDGDTPADRLELLEPQAEDWHCLVCVLTVSSMHVQHLYQLSCVNSQHFQASTSPLCVPWAR